MFSGCSQDGLRRSQIYRFSDVLACGSGGSGVSSGSDEPSMFAGSGGSCRSVDLMGLWILWVCGSYGSSMCGRSSGPDEPDWLGGSGWSGVNKRPCLSLAVHYGLLVEIHI